ncbi:EAL domain-containing protein [uncultured Maricaulis sp.]|uniref:putative bifunctional diguanylate cyclase/phosphodiesterase n=1 Tax=uncultured Maricaulis sp. TaxID=174710 RepID=UPI0030D88053|tara:strand:- start:401 stop:2461 length:2061 start_codon:yes stop_codon:yes gene_type:complete
MRSLVMKFTLLTGMLIFATTLMLMTLENIAAQRETRNLLAESSIARLQSTTDRIAGAIASNDTEFVQRYLTEMLASLDLSEVYALNNRREVLGSAYPEGEAPEHLSQSDLAVMALGAGDRRAALNAATLQVAVPVYTESRRLVGVVYASQELTELIRSRNAALRRQTFIALFALGIFLPLAALIVGRALKPVQTLTDAARLASSKTLDMRIDVHTGDELEVLANAFNRMFARLDGNLKRIHRLAYVDLVTELPNRERFRKETERVSRKALEDGETGAVLFLDLDRFKRVNDSLGIGEGDRMLEMVARRLSEVTRGCDLAAGGDGEPSLVARLGGDEFTVLLPEIDEPADAARIANKLVDAIRLPFEISGHQVFLGVSIGIAVFPQDGADPESLIRHADLAMAHAKRDGGSAARFFEPAMNQSAFERLVLENELRDAVHQDQLVVFYQPKIDMKTGIVAGAEALVRWQHPTAGLLSPGAFIEAAEECGLIGEIGDWVLRAACREGARWRTLGIEIPVAVNVSAMQFEREGFAESVLHALELADLPPHLLELELTESIAMENPERAIVQVQPLRDRGVNFAIDDFGTGHSSLSYLTRMPFDVFKIDQSFVRDMTTDPHARIVVETILAMAKALKLETVAEGVETQEQFEMLRAEGATLAQGFLFARPMPASDFVEYTQGGSALRAVAE